ncbi:hypothetical protein C3733_16670 [Bacillus amyloliquefaciens]|nr:hypothetical protein C3733_16670 [Bacillus amyloliquefaciens]
MEAYNYKFLALGMICPAAAGLKYSAYMLTVLISNIPILILSGFVLVIVSFIAITILTVRRWNGLKQKQQSLYK